MKFCWLGVKNTSIKEIKIFFIFKQVSLFVLFYNSIHYLIKYIHNIIIVAFAGFIFRLHFAPRSPGSVISYLYAKIWSNILII